MLIVQTFRCIYQDGISKYLSDERHFPNISAHSPQYNKIRYMLTFFLILFILFAYFRSPLTRFLWWKKKKRKMYPIFVIKFCILTTRYVVIIVNIFVCFAHIRADYGELLTTSFYCLWKCLSIVISSWSFTALSFL